MGARVAGRHGRHTASLVIACAVWAGGLASGCAGGNQADSGTGNRRGQEALIVDEARGTFRGLHFGDSRSQIRRRIAPARCSEEGVLIPLEEDVYEVGGRYTGEYQPRSSDGPDRQCVMRYARLAVEVSLSDGAFLFMTTDARARTRRGVGIGDSADLVMRRYPGAMCQGFEDTGDVDSVPGGCLLPPAETRDGVEAPRLSFGLDEDGEQVTSITIEAPSWQTIEQLKRR